MLIAPANTQVVNNNITFTVTHILGKSHERDWAPFDQIMTMIRDDAGMVVDVAITTTAARANHFVAAKIKQGLVRHPDSFALLERRKQLCLFN